MQGDVLCAKINIEYHVKEVIDLRMRVEYKTDKTRKICTDITYAKRQIPNDVAEKLMAHINFIEQAVSFEDIIKYPPFRFHKLHGDRKDEYALDIGKKSGYRIIITPLDENNKSLEDEKDINIIKQCTRIVLVLEVTNHYA